MPMGSLSQSLETLGEAAGVRLLGLGERLEPLRDLLETLAARALREARVHLRELVGLALDRRLEVQLRGADRHVGHRVADLLQEVEMPEGVAGLGLRGVAEEPAHVRIALDVRAAREVEVAAVRLRLASERRLQVVVCFAALECLCHHSSSRAGAIPAAAARDLLRTIPIMIMGGACQPPRGPRRSGPGAGPGQLTTEPARRTPSEPE